MQMLAAMKMHWHWIKTVLKSGWLWQNCIPKKNDYDSALVLYQEVIRADRKNRQACKGLIAIYEKQNNTDAILSLSEAVDDSLKDLSPIIR